MLALSEDQAQGRDIRPLADTKPLLILYLSKRCQMRPIGRSNTQNVLDGQIGIQKSRRPKITAQPKGIGGAYRDRTDDPLLAKQVLSQLS